MKRILMTVAALGLSVPAVAAADTLGGGPSTCKDEPTSCWETRAALGQYQETIDEIETLVFDPSPAQKYFLGMAYFGLAGRTGAAGLRCFYTLRATINLEAFLTDRRKLYTMQQTFGTSSEVTYTYAATRALESARRVTGCEESGESIPALQRYGRRFTTDRVESLFYNYRTPGNQKTALDDIFKARVDALEGAMRTFVSDASRMETELGLVLAEIESGRANLTHVKDAVNAWRSGSVTETDDATTGVSVFAYAPPFNDLDTDITSLKAYYDALVSPTGRLGAIKKTIDGFLAAAQATSLADYMRMRAAMLDMVATLTANLLSVNNFLLDVAQKPGVAALGTLTTSSGSSLDATWTQMQSAWKTKKCPTNPNKWYCK